jgi:hypothetical protein
MRREAGRETTSQSGAPVMFYKSRRRYAQGSRHRAQGTKGSSGYGADVHRAEEVATQPGAFARHLTGMGRRRHTWGEQMSKRRNLGLPPWLFCGSVASLRCARWVIVFRPEPATAPEPLSLLMSRRPTKPTPSARHSGLLYLFQEYLDHPQTGQSCTFTFRKRPLLVARSRRSRVGKDDNPRTPSRRAPERHCNTNRGRVGDKSVLLIDSRSGTMLERRETS